MEGFFRCIKWWDFRLYCNEWIHHDWIVVSISNGLHNNIIASNKFSLLDLTISFSLQSSESGLMLVISTMLSFINIVGCIFVFCYLGDGVTEYYNRIGLTLGQCKWYLYPMQIQRKIVPILIITQRPRFISGLSIIRCTIENFTGVWFTKDFFNY